MSRILLALVFSVVLLGVYSAEVPVEEGVLVLGEDNFDEVISSNQFVLVEFYAPWCGHCKKLAPEFAKAAQALEAQGSEVKLAKVDSTVHSALSGKFGVRGYPTLFFFRNGQKGDYKGGRDSPSILTWISKNTVTALPVLKSQEEIDAFVAKGTRSILFFTDKTEDSDLFNIAQSLEGVDVALVNGDLVTAELNGKVKITAPHLPEAVIGDRAALDNKFIYSNAWDSVSEYQREDWNRIAAIYDVLTITVIDYADEASKQSTIDTLRKIAPDFPQFALTYGDTKVWGSSATNMGATGNKYPTIIAVNTPRRTPSQQLVWDETQDLNEASIRAWLSGILDGSVQPFKKSEPIPESNDGPVKTIVHKNFDSIVNDNNVFIKFYAPWCGHCKSLAPIWDQLGEKFHHSSVTIAKLDATANYVDSSFGVSGFPTLIFIKADGTRIPYKGGRTLEELVKFVEETVPSAAGTATATDEHVHEDL